MSAYLPPDTVLGQIEAAVVVTDQQSNLLYANAYAAKLFDFPDAPERLVGRSLLSLGFEEEDLGKAADLVKQVLRGRAWDGTFASVRSRDGPRASTSSNPPGYSWSSTQATDSARCFSSSLTGITTETAGRIAPPAPTPAPPPKSGVPETDTAERSG